MKRRLLFPMAFLTFALSACGFEPLYGQRKDGVDVTDRLSQVKIGEIRAENPDILRGFRDFRPENARSAQILRNYLLDNLSPKGTAAHPQYLLTIRLIEPRSNLAVDRSDTVLRYGFSAVAEFRLTDGAGRTLLAGGSTSTTSFEASASEFATISSQRDARDRVMQEIGSDIRNQLAAFFATEIRKTASR